MQTQIIEINGKSLTIDLIHYVATHNDVKVTISEEVKKKIAKSRELVEKKVENQEVVYGLTTGFGEFKNKTISKEQTEELQKNLIISHSIGTGEAFKEEIIRAATLVRANSLVNGFSGIRLSTIEAMLDIINHNVYAYVPSKGSVGASGDLAPLSHLVACRMGYGEAYKGGKRIDSKIYLQEIGLSPLVLSSKEGLALNNGTSFMAGISALNLYKAEKLIKLSDIAYSMTLEACMGTVTACDHKVHDCRPHNGQIRTAENVRRLCNSSEIMESHKNCGRVQDSYSLRCTPQVHGAVKDSYNHVKSVIVTEI
ncbi:aromatic amino acid lyase, partial [Candidatus Falkowbacteria bacterium]|nr:aromatic amino acid lyase [Candidatus Falkowbacteria bacterium]